MPTAFAARWSTPGTPDGAPVLANIAEYDAVPGTSQEPVARREPRNGTHIHAAGHTDPHSALGIGALAGTLAAKAAMDKHGLKGTCIGVMPITSSNLFVGSIIFFANCLSKSIRGANSFG